MYSIELFFTRARAVKEAAENSGAKVYLIGTNGGGYWFRC